MNRSSTRSTSSRAHGAWGKRCVGNGLQECMLLETRCRMQPFMGGRRRCSLALRCTANSEAQSLQDAVSVVLLAGGSGKRMGAPIPKQYLELMGQPIAMYSLQVFAGMPEVFEIIIVCNPDYRALFQEYYEKLPRKPRLVFAEPGAERQDSVSNGFKAIDRQQAVLVAIHDSARPLITAEETRKCLQDGLTVGAAVLGVPVKPTIKEVRSDGTVVKTLKRSSLWEVQTPQVIRPPLLQAGFELVLKEQLEVTDDVSIIEALGEPVRITPGAYTNIKVTTPEDMIMAESFLGDRAAVSAPQPVEASA